MGNSRRKCRHCQAFSDAVNGFTAPLGFFCSIAHAIEFARERAAKVAARQAAKRKADNSKVEKAAKAELRQRKMEVKPIGYWMRRAQAAVNAWIRASKGSQCISCGRYHDGQMHAGHYRSTAAAPEIRFEPDNIWPQCQPCNVHLSANIICYRPALIAKIGLERVEWLEGPHEPKRYRREDYQAIEAEYKAKLKKLQGSCDDQD